MAPPSKSKFNTISPSSSKFLNIALDDDDFQEYPSPSPSAAPRTRSILPLKPSNLRANRPSKPLKRRKPANLEKENRNFAEADSDLGCGLDSIEPTLDLLNDKRVSYCTRADNVVESRNLEPIREDDEVNCREEASEGSSRLDVLLKLCADVDETGSDGAGDDLKCDVVISCPLCGADLSELSDDERQIHTNECLDNVEAPADVAAGDDDAGAYRCPGQVLDGSPLKPVTTDVDVSPVVEWLRNLGLGKYAEIFVRQEIDWDALQTLEEEDLCHIGITTLGPRKKILHALSKLRSDLTRTVEPKTNPSGSVPDETKLGMNKLITDFFSGPRPVKRAETGTNGQSSVPRSKANTSNTRTEKKDHLRNGKQKDVPSWCGIPGTQFHVDGFKYLRRDCSHYFLTHFHLDHYQGLTKSFSHGVIYCSLITAKLVNLKLGIPWANIQVLPLREKINIAGTNITCFDANHCPGAIIILFEPPNGKPVLHTGDFRFCEEMTELFNFQACPVHTLILDTTYCNPQYDFPKQEAIIQFVIDAIRAEAFNPKTLFLIGSYTIGKERVFLEVAKALHKKVYVTAAKLRILECLGFKQEDMQWFTTNEQESHIHVVPMWSIASFKRLDHMAKHYMGRFSLIVAFSPTGWSFGKGKKSTGRRWQKGTMIRYEVPYSEHSSFMELKEFVKLISPANIIPSVNNHGPDSQNAMVSQLLS
ncbi:DNA cross-link repair 1A protein-like [Salvia splendens]|uniref:DNA cross-link repair 1A protein-like n=1 Tax=Salvia splendens TaxID=180675 RepID=UPI001C253B2C|nr:DNA cross-link repair 1A protein-like [Salvia splendens]XP_042031828.1 DNA cross-link repair 1A protein-like [Salvia splendens]